MATLALHLTLTLALAESIGLAVLLWLRAGTVRGARYLVLFLLGVAAWIASCELPNLFGPAAIEPARWLIALSPLTSAVFLHFVLLFCDAPRSVVALWSIYLVAGSTTAIALIIPPGNFEPWRDLEYFFVPNAVGWAAGAVWAALAIAGLG